MPGNHHLGRASLDFLSDVARGDAGANEGIFRTDFTSRICLPDGWVWQDAQAVDLQECAHSSHHGHAGILLPLVFRRPRA